MHPANMPTKMRTTLFLRSVSVCLRTLHQHKLAPVSTEGRLLVCTSQALQGVYVYCLTWR